MKKTLRLISAFLCVLIACSSIYVCVSAAIKFKVGDIIEFGSYPQTKVRDELLLSKLNELIPDENGNVCYNGEYYFKAIVKKQDNNTSQIVEETFWFYIEPIEWRVLKSFDDKLMLLSEDILERGAIDNTYNSHWSINTDLFDFLQSDFLCRAFSPEEQKYILSEIMYDNDGVYSKTCKVSLLSRDAYVDPLYGFDSVEIDEEGYCVPSSASRVCYSTDYAKLNGGIYYYWTSTPVGNLMAVIDSDNGEANDSRGNWHTESGSSIKLGIRPVISIYADALKNDSIYSTGDIVEFGSYPQTEVVDGALIAILEELIRDENDDVFYNGIQYHRLYLGQYDFYTQESNGYKLETPYWFIVEPIKWRVLSSKDNVLFLLSDIIIDSMPYQGPSQVDNEYYFSGFWDSSYLYKWMQDYMVNRAFNNKERNELISYPTKTSYWDSDFIKESPLYAIIAPLSLRDYTNTAYGFEKDVGLTEGWYRTESETRLCKYSGYSRAMGYNIKYYGTTTDFGYDSSVAVSVYDGSIRYSHGDTYSHCDNIGIGVRPAIKINQSALETEPEHICTPAEKWSADETAHWLECTDPECGEIINYAEHSGGNATVNAKAVCEHCGTAYGEYVAASFSVEPVSDIAYCKREKREYKITVAENADKIQFIRESGSTTTFVRSQAAEIINNGDGTETWILAVSLNKGKYTLATKYGKVWNKNGIEFEIVFDTPKCRSFASEKVGNLTTFTVVTDPQVAKVQLITQSGNTLTYTQSNSYIGEDGLRYWTVVRKITKPGTIGLRTKYGYTWTTTDFTIDV